MQLDERGGLILSPSDLVAYLACEHLSELSLAVARGERARPTTADPEVEIVRRRGIEHERVYRDRVVADGATLEEAAEGSTEARVARTAELLRAGVPVVYQAAFFSPGEDGRASWLGYADFVRRIETPSDLGSFSYEPDDTKLARRVKPSAVLQLCEYAEQLARLQGRPPEQIHVVLGGSERVSLRTADFAAYLRAAKCRLEAALAVGISAYPWPVVHCKDCSWRETCDEQRLADDHLTLVAGLTGEQARRLQAVGISTLAKLATTEVASVPKMGSATLERLKGQARLQVLARETGGSPPYELLESAGPGIGLAALPEPDPADLFFDIEGDPFVAEGGLEYLLGVAWVTGGELVYRAFWAHDAEEEKASFEAFIDFVIERLDAHPGMHVYHYAPYEPVALGRLMGRYATREEEVDRLLRGGVLVDAFRVLRQSARVGVPSYSLKKVESLYMQARTEAVTDAGSSIVEYERWLEEGDPTILDQLAEYNRVDCDSTRRLRDWLEDRRPEYAGRFGELPPRPSFADGAPSEGLVVETGAVAALKEALRIAVGAEPGVPAPATDGGSEQNAERHAAWLLGELLDWHRREDKPEWWTYFHRVQDCDEEELFHDTEAVSGLDYVGPVATPKQSVVHRYRFSPDQEHKLATGQSWHDPVTVRQRMLGGPRASSPGEIVAVDLTDGVVDLKRSAGSAAPHPRCLVPPGPIPTATQREALRRLANWVAGHGIDADGPYRSVRDLLLRHPPRLVTGLSAGLLRKDGEEPDAAAVRLAGELDGGCLAMQGPPGSGKTRTAARVVVALVRAGKKVGLTAHSHAVIANLLDAVLEEADRQGVAIRAAQKAGDGRAVRDRRVSHEGNAGMEAALDTAAIHVLAGTSWLFTRPAFEGRLDHLVVDEAGQLSLANVVAVGTAACNLLLVGDPRQLAQPSKGTHPPGAELSALSHLLGPRETMPDDLGLFLATTHRLHPDICAFISEVFYEDRLRSEPGCERQSVGGDDALAGSGLRWSPVPHAGNRSSSVEEAEVVYRHYRALLGRPFTDRTGKMRPLGAEDILVVAPYNAQVSLLGTILPGGARVGTVDKFQGQEAPVVIFSLAASSAEEVVRGMEFLYSRNRLNVAVSRAQGLAVLVGSPALLSARCRSVDQLRLVNGLCRFVEMATELD